MAELAGDAWQELSGYDGRIAETFRHLFHPGRLTIDYIAGRRARYLPPVKLYLTVSVIFFLLSATAPQLDTRGGLQIGITQSGRDNSIPMTDADRAALIRNIETAPWFMKPMLRAVAQDPEGFRARMFSVMPRVFFGLLPVFAAIVAMFYRGKRFPTALVFAVHVHAFAYLIFAFAEAAKFTRVSAFAALVSLVASVTFAVYVLRSFRAVFGGSWPKTLLKAAGIGFVYSLAAVPAFLIIFVWASLT